MKKMYVNEKRSAYNFSKPEAMIVHFKIQIKSINDPERRKQHETPHGDKIKLFLSAFASRYSRLHLNVDDKSKYDAYISCM